MLKTEAYTNSSLFLALSKKNGYKAGVLYAYKGDGFIWDRNSTAYRTNSAGLLESMAIDVPRVDYSNTCPEILIENEATNLVLYSSDFSNAAHSKYYVTIATDATASPTGSSDADKIIATSVNNRHSMEQTISSITGVYTQSVYAKKGELEKFSLYDATSTGGWVSFNLNLGTIISTGAGASGDVKDIGNGWYLCSITYNCTSKTRIDVWLLSNSYTSGDPYLNSFTGDDVSGLYFWNYQLESGYYPTSAIPTTSATVTRLQDIAYNTSIDVTGLVGTIFVRVRVSESPYAKTDTILSINDGTTDNYILIFTDENRDITISTYSNPDQNDYTYSVFGADGVYNIAVGYDFSGANNLINISIDGVQTQSIITQVNNPPTALNRIDLGSIVGNLPQVDNRIIGVQWFNTQLDDSSLVNITT